MDADAALRLYVEIEAAVEAEALQSYRAVLTETARRIAARLGWPLPESRAGFLADSMPAWPPFPDTNPALRRLTDAGYRLGILSNVDDDLLAWTRRHLAAFFEIVVTAQQAGSYKPAPGHFTTRARASSAAARWLHAAQSYFHDVVPARALGIPVALDQPQGRGGNRRQGKPDRECSHAHGARRLARALVTDGAMRALDTLASRRSRGPTGRDARSVCVDTHLSPTRRNLAVA